MTRELAVRFENKEHWLEWSWSHGTRGMWELVPVNERPAVGEQAFEARRWRAVVTQSEESVTTKRSA